ncbi:hypothetical protein BD770DRAFT_461180 [Pilaira anomala]|nr:hypothetical protein BD770DRAFT_461180 [Pilaira anomala]
MLQLIIVESINLNSPIKFYGEWDLFTSSIKRRIDGVALFRPKFVKRPFWYIPQRPKPVTFKISKNGASQYFLKDSSMPNRKSLAPNKPLWEVGEKSTPMFTPEEESITLDETKKIISKGLETNDGNTDGSRQDISISLIRFKQSVLESLSTSLLTVESHLQHLLSLSNILLIGKKSYHTDLERHFISRIDCIRKSIYSSLKFKDTNHKFPMDIMMALIQIVNDLNCGSSRKDTVTKILALTNDNTDPIVTQLLSCVKSMKSKSLSYAPDICNHFSNHSLTVVGDDKIIFKWTNTIGLNDNLTPSRPDGYIKDSRKSLGFVEVKPIDKAKDHKKINLDLHCLGIFSKETITQYKLKRTFSVMAIGTNVKFYLSEPVDNVLTMVELDTLHLPLSLKELPQIVPYLNRLYNVTEAIFNCCYNESNLFLIFTVFSFVMFMVCYNIMAADVYGNHKVLLLKVLFFHFLRFYIEHHFFSMDKLWVLETRNF